MNFWESVKGALKNLRGNKTRSVLTMLGIIIGISSVITMSSIGAGGQKNITGDLQENGYGKFTVSVDRDDSEFRWKYLLDEGVLEQISETGEFKRVAHNISDRMTIDIDNRKEMIELAATNPNYEEIEKIQIMAGRTFLPFEYESGENLVLIDNFTARDIYGSVEKAVGEEIAFSKDRKSSKITYKIVGVFKNPLEELIKIMGGRRFPRFMRTPVKTYDKIYDLSSGGYNSLILEANDPENMGEAMRRAKEILEKISGEQGLYEVSSMSNAAASFDRILSTLNIFISFVAGISLFVGGIGVMNIMLVSVIERTKEIGIRKAIGARNRDILFQFLIESVILTGIGGILGIFIGVISALGIGTLMGIKPIFSIIFIISAFIISTFIGIIFGVAPARKAAYLNPIDALRSE
ncbi:MAG: ABC transporter permease [Fusobacteriaceae bacterium]